MDEIKNNGFEKKRDSDYLKRDTDKHAFLLYNSFYKSIRHLSREQKGELFDAIYQYNLKEETFEITDKVVEMAFSFFKNQFDIDKRKYEIICEKKRENGQKGGIKKSENNQKNSEKANKLNDNLANVASATNSSKRSKCYKIVANVADNDNDYEYEKEHKENDKDLIKNYKVVNTNLSNTVSMSEENTNDFENRENKELFTKSGVDVLEYIAKMLKDDHSSHYYFKVGQRLGADRLFGLACEFGKKLKKELSHIAEPSAYFTESLKEYV